MKSSLFFSLLFLSITTLLPASGKKKEASAASENSTPLTVKEIQLWEKVFRVKKNIVLKKMQAGECAAVQNPARKLVTAKQVFKRLFETLTISSTKKDYKRIQSFLDKVEDYELQYSFYADFEKKCVALAAEKKLQESDKNYSAKMNELMKDFESALDASKKPEDQARALDHFNAKYGSK